jgi:hypothetical protein
MKRAHLQAAIAAAIAEAPEPMVEQAEAAKKLLSEIEAATERQIEIKAAIELAPPRPSRWAGLVDDGVAVSRPN